MEVLLGPDDRGNGLPGGDLLAPVVAGSRPFQQAQNYLKDKKIRAWVLHREACGSTGPNESARERRRGAASLLAWQRRQHSQQRSSIVVTLGGRRGRHVVGGISR